MGTEIQLYLTQRGEPAIWEEGGGLNNAGWARIIAGERGEPLTPIFIRRRGALAGGRHALFIARIGIIVVEAHHSGREFEITVWRVCNLTEPHEWAFQSKKFPGAIIDIISVYRCGAWLPMLREWALPAVLAATQKARCYHCRRPHYIAKQTAETVKEARE